MRHRVPGADRRFLYSELAADQRGERDPLTL